MFISARHKVYGELRPVTEWSLELQLEVFYERVDGWHLRVADRIINGWGENQKPCIVALTTHNRELIHHVPDSGWAVLQIVLNYFETISTFTNGSELKGARDRFEDGFQKVFPEFTEQINKTVSKSLWELRNGLYHQGLKSSNIILRYSTLSLAINYISDLELIFLDPHEFTRRLRNHLEQYISLVRTNAEYQHKFKKVFEKIFED